MSRLETIAANSFCDFHTKGFDYLCLHRSPELTVKAYFFDEVAASNPELVMPHDHRYGFTTTVLAGHLSEMRWREPRDDYHDRGRDTTYQEFAYRTPLNGGAGFEWVGERKLVSCAGTGYHRGQTYMTPREQIHTLANIRPGTVIVLHQFADELPIGEPTRAFRRGDRERPSTDGLYEKMTPDYARDRINQLIDLGWPTNPLREPAA